MADTRFTTQNALDAANANENIVDAIEDAFNAAMNAQNASEMVTEKYDCSRYYSFQFLRLWTSPVVNKAKQWMLLCRLKIFTEQRKKKCH